VQNHSGPARRCADSGVVERVELYDLGTGGCAGGAAGPHQARDRPAGIAERLSGLVAEPPGGAEHQDTRTHDRRPARRIRIRVGPASDAAMVRAVLVISNAANLIASGN
jgi:hypothetical protein